VYTIQLLAGKLTPFSERNLKIKVFGVRKARGNLTYQWADSAVCLSLKFHMPFERLRTGVFQGDDVAAEIAHKLNGVLMPLSFREAQIFSRCTPLKL
jgi:hypothetical protein